MPLDNDLVGDLLWGLVNNNEILNINVTKYSLAYTIMCTMNNIVVIKVKNPCFGLHTYHIIF